LLLSQVIVDLAAEANGVNTLKQFAAVKFDDIEWQPQAQAGKKGFVRLAIRMYKATHGAQPHVLWLCTLLPVWPLTGDAEKVARMSSEEQAPNAGAENQ
jgi:hypothetical protein